MELVLHTERLILRPLQPEDVDLALEMFTDPLVVRYVCVPTKPDDIRAEMTNKVKRCGGGCIGIWCVLDRTTSEKLGTCILLPMPIGFPPIGTPPIKPLLPLERPMTP